MIRQSGFPAASRSLPAWNIFFAREPEPDLELDDLDETDKSSPMGSSSEDPEEPEKPSSRRRLTLALLAVLLVAGAYLAMDPGPFMELLGQGVPRATEPPPTTGPSSRQAAKPTPQSPSPVAPTESTTPSLTTPDAPPTAQPTPAAPMGPFPS
ncbi:MAG: hypothetical protein FJ246_08315, partial [Nitrospira sp.]|nr:hypothetical protein [Nitrospira sp.]